MGDAPEPSTPSEDPADTAGALAFIGSAKSWATTTFEQYRDRSPVDVGLRLYERDRQAAGAVIGSAIAFRLFQFFIPLLLFLVGIAGFFASAVDNRDLDDAGIAGVLAEQINAAMEQPGSARWLAIGIGLVGILTTGRTLSRTMIAASCLTWGMPVKTKASLRLIGTMIGLLVGVGLMAMLSNLVRHRIGLGVAGLSFLPAVGVYALVWFVVLGRLPRPTADPGPLVPGSLLLAATLAAMQAFSQLYLPGRISSASELYGGIGLAIVTLGWFFIIGRVVVVAMTVNAVIYDRFGSISQFIFGLPLIRYLPRRWPWFRRKFELGEEHHD